MNVNVDNFKNVLKKATMNNSISSVQLNINPTRITSNMISESRDIIIILDVENDLMQVSEELEFNFADPAQGLIPFLNLIDDTADLQVSREKIHIKSGKQKANVHFCSPTVVNVFPSKSVREGVEFFVTLDLNDEFVDHFSKIKKIGSRFGKIYLSVEGGVLFIETTDKTNRFSNSLKFELETDRIESTDLTMCFDYKNFSNLMTVLDGRIDEFKMNLAYIVEQEMGMLFVENEEGTEKYYLMSREI